MFEKLEKMTKENDRMYDEMVSERENSFSTIEARHGALADLLKDIDISDKPKSSDNSKALDDMSSMLEDLLKGF